MKAYQLESILAASNGLYYAAYFSYKPFLHILFMVQLLRFFYFPVLFLAFSSAAHAMLTANTIIIGAAEYVAIDGLNMKMRARIDTGAGMTSLHADIIDIKPGENGEADKVIFNISDHRGNVQVVEKNIERWIRIKKKGKAGKAGHLRRPVVMMSYCLGGKQLEGQTNLANRSHFKYPLLIGRNVLKTGDYLVRAGLEFAHKANCGKS